MESSFLRLPAVRSLCNISRSTIYRLEAEGRFPARIRLSKRVTAWRADDIAKWLQSRPLASETPRAA